MTCWIVVCVIGAIGDMAVYTGVCLSFPAGCQINQCGEIGRVAMGASVFVDIGDHILGIIRIVTAHAAGGGGYPAVWLVGGQFSRMIVWPFSTVTLAAINSAAAFTAIDNRLVGGIMA